ncbi:hypothetical protein LXA43DRAFT_1100891 [Ganoderma leucocontextum]|nr:hypothetical protein LXA43DRAFT_1100891 [Ganoderma leucocontextum]
MRASQGRQMIIQVANLGDRNLEQKWQNDFQRAFLEVRDKYLHRILTGEAPPPGGLGVCGHPALWRCLSCHGKPAYCTACCKASHERHPLHRVELWQGTHFAPSALRLAGVQIRCGHGGAPYPAFNLGEASPQFQSTDDALLDAVNPDRPSDDQDPEDEDDLGQYLLDDDPDDFDDEDCGPEAADLPEWLRPEAGDLPQVGEPPVPELGTEPVVRCTGGTRMVAVVDIEGDRYKALLRVSRQWRNLKLRKWAGFGHTKESIGPSDLTVRCPSCPRPDINLPDNWREDPEQWKYTLSVVLDGNFSAQHRQMRNPNDDVPLADGHGFMVKDHPYKEHLKTAVEIKQTPTCNDHRAALNSDLGRSKLESTGIGAAACSCHGFFLPHACVDFQCGAANFIPGIGMQDGEILETLWAKINPSGSSTRGMSSAHHREVIDDHMNDSNWMKLTRITSILNVKWRRACKEWQPALAAFQELCAAAGEVQTSAWMEEAARADEGRNDKVEAMDIYDVPQDMLPSRKAIELSLTGSVAGPMAGASATAWVSTGLALEEHKLAVAYTCWTGGPGDTAEQKLMLARQREKLDASIRSFSASARAHLPAVMTTGELAVAQDHTPDEIEWELRIGQMNDALQAIRTGIGYKALLYQWKVQNASSFRTRLRSHDKVRQAQQAVTKYVRIYMAARAALDRLFDPQDLGDAAAREKILSRYRTIAPADLRASTAVLEAFTPGLRNEHAAWFWNLGDASNDQGGSDRWMQQYRRMLWLRAYARKQRWEEEITLVPLEMEWTVQSFAYRATEWKAAMWEELRAHAAKAFADIQRRYVPR